MSGDSIDGGRNPRPPTPTKASARRPKGDDYEVGYGRPPTATRFKKGRSGNPSGARKKQEIDDVRIVIENVLAEPVKLRDGDKVRTLSTLEWMLRTQHVKALKGDPKAAKAIFKLAQKSHLFSQAKPASNIVIEPAGSNSEERMILRAFHAQAENVEADYQAADSYVASDRPHER
jgi:hypothetical protein